MTTVTTDPQQAASDFQAIAMAKIATEYLKKGLSVIPIRTDGSRAPAIKSWAPYQDKKPTCHDARRWFRLGDVGIAVVAGKASGNLEIIDFDKPGEFDIWKAMVDEKKPGLVDSLHRVHTPSGGEHIYYRCSEIAGPQKLAFGEWEVVIDGKKIVKHCKIETKGHGGYVLAPPSPASCHPLHKPYVLANKGGIKDLWICEITKEQRKLLLNTARELSEKIEVVEPVWDNGNGNIAHASGDRPGDEFAERTPWSEILLPHGWKLERLRGDVVDWTRPGKPHGVSATTGHCGEGDGLLYVFSSNAPPFAEGKAYGKFVAYTLLNFGGDFSRAAKELATCGFGAPVNSGSNGGSTSGITVDADETQKNPCTIKTGSHKELADKLITILKGKGELVSTQSNLWRYEPTTGAWSQISRDAIEGAAQAFDGAVIGSGKRAHRVMISYPMLCGIRKTVLTNPSLVDPDFFNHPPAGILVRNGFVRVKGPDGNQSLVLEPFKPSHRARFALDWDYEPCCGCSEWDALLQRVFEGDSDAVWKSALLNEFVGAALLGVAIKLGKILVLTGKGRTGKSTVLDIISSLFTKSMVTSVPPHKWGSDYHLVMLAGSRLNVCNELAESKIVASENFKTVITGEPVTARNPYERAFSFVPTTAHLFACNALPGTVDQTNGFWRRVIVLPFNRQFNPTNGALLPHKADIVERMMVHRGEIFSNALQHGLALIRRGSYQEPESSLGAKSTWRSESDNVLAWIEENAIVMNSDDPNAWMYSGAAYTLYKQWALDSGFRPLNIVHFGRRLSNLQVNTKRTARQKSYNLSRPFS